MLYIVVNTDDHELASFNTADEVVAFIKANGYIAVACDVYPVDFDMTEYETVTTVRKK